MLGKVFLSSAATAHLDKLCPKGTYFLIETQDTSKHKDNIQRDNKSGGHVGEKKDLALEGLTLKVKLKTNCY